MNDIAPADVSDGAILQDLRAAKYIAVFARNEVRLDELKEKIRRDPLNDAYNALYAERVLFGQDLGALLETMGVCLAGRKR